MDKLKRVRERVAKMEGWLGNLAPGSTTGFSGETVQWLCDQLSGFLNGEEVKRLEGLIQLHVDRENGIQFVNELRETVKQIGRRERVLQRELSVAREECGDYLKVCDERDRLREQLAERTQQRDEYKYRLQTWNDANADVIHQAVAAERERCAKECESSCAGWYGKVPCTMCPMCIKAAAIRRPPEEVPDGK